MEYEEIMSMKVYFQEFHFYFSKKKKTVRKIIHFIMTVSISENRAYLFGSYKIYPLCISITEKGVPL